VGYVYVMYYFAIITSIMMPRDDPGETNRPYLRAGCHKNDVMRVTMTIMFPSTTNLTNSAPLKEGVTQEESKAFLMI
jgi:hypothetical protein